MRTAEGLADLAKIVDGVGPELSAIVSGTSPDDRRVTDFVALAHQLNLSVHPYTVRADQLPKYVESLDELHQLLLIDAQVDGVFTDFPDLTAEFIRENRIGTTRLQGLEPVVLWQGTPPGRIAAKGEERDMSNEKSNKVEGKWVTRLGDVSRPTMTLYPAPAATNTGTCVLVCPGGGYHILAWDLEGTEVCQWLNSIGVSAALLKYRVPRADKEVPVEPLQDAQRALSLLRSRAVEWQIKPDRIGILGFSAGGHLSARVSTQYESRAYEAVDNIDQISSRPDFTLLIYPAYLFDKDKDELINPELPVNSQTPPMFLTMALDDPIDSENILRMSTALKRAKVANEVHLYPTGGHGYGLRRNQHEATGWPQRATEWMRSRGLLDR
jgi:acetyl esterase/lipase